MDADTALRWALVFLALSVGAFLLSQALNSSIAILQIKEAYIIEEPTKQQNQSPIFIRRS